MAQALHFSSDSNGTNRCQGPTDGQKWELDKIKVLNVPEDSKFVDLFWGDDQWRFVRLSYARNATATPNTLETSERWYLNGNTNALKAIAINSSGEILGSITIELNKNSN